MAVYTKVSAEALSAFLARYDVGELVSMKGIAEGVENSNYFVETTGAAVGGLGPAGEHSRTRFILTLYEKRVDIADLPFFLGLTAHLSHQGLPVPAPIPDRDGAALQQLEGRPACLIEFLPGVSVSEVTPALARAAGDALARLHLGVEGFSGTRPNTLGLAGWEELAYACKAQLSAIDPALPALVAEELAWQRQTLPADIPAGIIHADLFPDNVLIQGGEISGLIDFYFACHDRLAYDLAITHAAWAFDDDGLYRGDPVAEALLEGYRNVRPLTAAEHAALPGLQRGAALRFLLTRAYDWINTPPGAMVTRKDPMAFARRLRHYQLAS
ncbi:homoserine kinase [Pacificimonas sp. WHA3]|uniref:Homoserine kinase n=1 Tax=Pacificimonas pallii TaxID=2827236 RepID=A0ABS6SA54_9SPHN|nr:homoserine kinase [Pacificimonas pallii]MBV7255253.1 homoserine kinase [Pacificimonas pallii]